MSSTDGAGRPWDLDQYRPGAKRTVRAPRSDVPGQIWDDSLDDGRDVRAKYDPEGQSLLWLATWTSMLTVLTIGFYRFWMITRLRRYYWSAVKLEGDPFEYTGRGIEKFLGFLIAIVFLAIYLALVNLALTFAGLSLGSEIAINASVLSALPLWYFAVYRSRRYIAARTRWRGIRFGMEHGAWAFALRAILYGLLAICTLGLLYPLMHFRLEKYMIERTWFGDQRFEQGGSWLGLFGHWIWIYVTLLILGLAAWTAASAPEDMTSLVIALLIGAFAYTLLMIAFLHYQVAAFRYFWDHRTLGGARFENDISSMGVVWVYIGGSILISLCVTVVALVLFFVAGLIASAFLGAEQAGLLEGLMEGELSPGILAAWPALLAGVVLYLTIFAAIYAFTQVFIVQPVTRRKAEGMTVINPNALNAAHQREHDAAAEAGGFADALGVDVGAGF